MEINTLHLATGQQIVTEAYGTLTVENIDYGSEIILADITDEHGKNWSYPLSYNTIITVA